METKLITLSSLLFILCIFVAEPVQAQRQEEVTVCKRKWYCLWACKKCTTEIRYCYDFTSIHTSCRVFWETLHGCSGGNEYKWTAGCFGWVTGCLQGRTVCFKKPLESIGGCNTSLCDAPIIGSTLGVKPKVNRFKPPQPCDCDSKKSAKVEKIRVI